MIERCKKYSNAWVVLWGAVLLVSLQACSPRLGQSRPALTPGAQDPTPAAPIASQQPHASTPDPLPGSEQGPSAINPLTGLPVSDDRRLTQRPILIKVTLYPRNNRPQWGLSQADLVFEHYTEGGLSRFSALFYGSEAERVGPIRSARLVDLQLLRMYGALFAYGSADYRVLERIDQSELAERAVREFPAGCPPLCRIDPASQNHLVTDTRALQDFYAGQGIDLAAPVLEGMTFDAATQAGGDPGTRLWISYSADNFHEWAYAAETGGYRRSQEIGDGTAALAALNDKLSDAPIEAANVVLLRVPHQLYSRSPEIVDIQLYGEGEGLALRDGKAYPVRWIRPYPEGVLYLTHTDDREFPFKPGSTWFEIVGTSSTMTTNGDGRWVVEFSQP